MTLTDDELDTQLRQTVHLLTNGATVPPLGDARRLHRRRQRRQRAMLGTAASLVMVGGTAWGISAHRASPHGSTVAASPTAETPPPTATSTADSAPAGTPGTTVPGFAVLAMLGDRVDLNSIHHANTERELRSVWGELHLSGDIPTVDWAQRYVMMFTIPTDDCPPRLVALAQPSAHVLEPVFTPPAASCTDPLIARTYVVSIRRQAGEPALTYQLPADASYSLERSQLTIDAR